MLNNTGLKDFDKSGLNDEYWSGQAAGSIIFFQQRVNILETFIGNIFYPVPNN